ncbi:hypothetical protein K466DRAFT_666677 [Polyporus arcularius HHB13444]|uniref:Uncharacterized protein n=1 Tax=Polyporus arcularius HHB13444 TaxID=1314778 RepID=A0A5C3NXM7_9APHY|nr:hypothetical protein K466DRAFT_666677 [Polyporus arcularius HHB13444]
MIDPAMCRPGRLDKLLYVDLPTADERAEIVRKMTRKVPHGSMAAVASSNVIQQMVVKLVWERLAQEGQSALISMDSFVQGYIRLSVSVWQRKIYEALRSKFAGLPVRTAKGMLVEDIDGADSTSCITGTLVIDL